MATVIVTLTLLGIVIVFLNILIAVLGGAYSDNHQPGVYLRYFAVEAYMPSLLLRDFGAGPVGFLREVHRDVMQSIRPNPDDEPDESQWNIISVLGFSQFRRYIRQQACTIGDVADISRQTASLIQLVRSDTAESETQLSRQLDIVHRESQMSRDAAEHANPDSDLWSGVLKALPSEVARETVSTLIPQLMEQLREEIRDEISQSMSNGQLLSTLASPKMGRRKK